MKILLGTNNAGKVIEISEVLEGLEVEILTPKHLDITGDIDETGTTFRANAMLKAKHYHGLSKLPTVADDSGIIVEALADELGVQTRRWGAGPDATDEEWIEHFLKRMKKEKNKRAKFVCCLAFINEKGEAEIFEGECSGVITDSLEAPYLKGLPISACFRPDGFSAVYSAMNIEQKNSTSHRGRALKKLQASLSKELENRGKLFL